MIESSIRLGSGSRVDYCELGSVDAPTVIYCHGTPGSRLELLLARHALERNRVPIRLIGLNRPGYGKSSFVPYQGFLPWAEVVNEATDRLGVERFSVLGASGGSPFALACAHSLADRVDRVGIVAGVAPPDTPGMQRAAPLANEFASTAMRAVRYGALSLAARAGLAGLLTRRLIGSLGSADREALASPGASASLEMVVREAFAQRGRAAVLEAGLFMRPWDFEPARISQDVRLWHGTEDTRIPAEVATSMADRIPGASCALWPGHGHFSWAMGDEVATVTEFLTA